MQTLPQQHEILCLNETLPRTGQRSPDFLLCQSHLLAVDEDARRHPASVHTTCESARIPRHLIPPSFLLFIHQDRHFPAKNIVDRNSHVAGGRPLPLITVVGLNARPTAFPGITLDQADGDSGGSGNAKTIQPSRESIGRRQANTTRSTSLRRSENSKEEM